MRRLLQRILGRTSEAQLYPYSEFKFATDRQKILKGALLLKKVSNYDGVITCAGTGGEMLGNYLARKLEIPNMVVEVESRIKRTIPHHQDDVVSFQDEPRITLARASMPQGVYLVAVGWLPTSKLVKALQRRYANCTLVIAALVVSEGMEVDLVGKTLHGRVIGPDVQLQMFWETW